MSKKIIMIIVVLLVIVTVGSIYYFKIYMNEKNILERYLEEHKYSCVGNNCTKKEKDVKYSFDLKNRDLYISKDKYSVAVGTKSPILRFKNSNKLCNYEIDNYEVGDLIDDNFTYDKDCEEYIEDINVYIEEYKTIVNVIK